MAAAATIEDIERWKATAKENGDRFIISVCDTWDYDDYPVYCKDEEELEERKPNYMNVNMQRINEVIDMNKEE